MSCRIDKSKISGKIVCPPNKSYTHRALLIATLADGKSVVKNILHSRDTKATIEACKIFGAEIEENNNDIAIKGKKEIKTQNAVIDAANSGTTIRIAAAIASLSEGKTTLSGDSSLQQRPMQPLLDALQALGAKCTSTHGKPPLTITGKIKGGEITIPGNISSQFISALMIVAPLTENGIILNIKEELVSKPYLDATIATMKKFGVKVETVVPYKKYNIPSQKYLATTVTIPSDFSSLGLLMVAAVLLGDELTIEITKGELPQGDEKIIDILKNLGVEVSLDNGNIKVKSPKLLIGGRFDLNSTPDLLAPLSICALKTANPIELYNVKHARYKETDRISVLARELSKLGVKVDEKDDGLMLQSPDEVKEADLNSENDHRLFMAFCIAAMYVGNCTVSNPESVDVSYPNFLSDIKMVGGKISKV